MRKLKTFIDVSQYDRMVKMLGHDPKIHCGNSFSINNRQVYVIRYDDYLKLKSKIKL